MGQKKDVFCALISGSLVIGWNTINCLIWLLKWLIILKQFNNNNNNTLFIYPIDKWPVTNLYVKLKATEVNSILDSTGKTSIDNCFLTLNSKGVISEQLLNGAESDVKNYADRGGSYLSRLRAEVDKIPRDLHSSSHHTKAKFNNCFMIHSKYFYFLNKLTSS